jgi:hypothetical protein
MSTSWKSEISDRRSYRFTVHKDDGTETLGFMAFAGDAEAVAFGERVIEDMTLRDDGQFANWTMNITEGNRAVCSISLNAGRQKKYG